MKRVIRATVVLCLSVAATAAAAQSKIELGYTAIADYASMFIAKDQGIFQKHGLDVDPVLIAVNPSIPAALVGGSLQIGGPTAPVLLQANDGGLDLVVLAGAGVTDPRMRSVGIVAGKGASIVNPADLVGKKIAVPGIGSLLDVMLREWLHNKGVDVTKITFIEVALPAIGDALKTGSVDAAVVVGPFYTRAIDTGVATLIAPYLAEMPAATPTTLYVATRSWAKAHPEAVMAFRDSIVEANIFAAAHPDETRQIIGKFIKLPPPVLASIDLPYLQAKVTEGGIDYWTDVMHRQNLLQGSVDFSSLVIQ